MQEVSAKWKETQEQRIITAPSVLEVTVAVTDPEAQGAASVSVDSEEEFSHGSQLADGMEKTANRYATLEQDLWALDGTFDLLPDEGPYEDDGWISENLSGDGGVFTLPPTITISFPQVFTTYLEGMTITWGAAYEGEMADTFTVAAYRENVVVASKTVTGNTDLTSVVFLEMSGYDTIKITVEKWSAPGHRARVQSVFLGVRHTYTRKKISDYSHAMGVDLLSAELPEVEVAFQVENLDYLYDPDNENGMSKYLMTRQQVEIRYGYEIDGKTEMIPAAVVFLDEWESPRDGIHANFTARSLLVFLEETYTGPNSGTLYDIAQAALVQAGLPLKSDGTVRWVLSETLKSIYAAEGADLSETSMAEVLQFCANAGCCVMWQDREGVFHMEPFSVEETAGYGITKEFEFGYPETTLSKQLKTVNINNGAYILNVSNSGVEQTVSNPLISAAQAPTVAAWIRDLLLNRQTLSGTWRADPKVDTLDTVAVDTPFKTNRTVLTSVELTFNGAWRGSYEGRVIYYDKEGEG